MPPQLHRECRGIFDKFGAVEFAAAGAVIAQHRAVQLIDLFRPRLLVQAIDVLGYHRKELSLLLPLCENPVGDVGFKAQRQHFLPVKPEEILRVPLIKAVADDSLRRVVEFLVVQPVHAPEIRDSGLRTHSRAAEKDDAVTLLHPCFQSFQLVHGLPPPFPSAASCPASTINPAVHTCPAAAPGCGEAPASAAIDAPFFVIAGEQNFRHRPPVPYRRTAVLGYSNRPLKWLSSSKHSGSASTPGTMRHTASVTAMAAISRR